MAEPLDISRLVAEVRTRRIGRSIAFDETIDSTNDEAWRRAGDGAADGLVVIADHQTAGRGRNGNRWFAAPRESLLLTALVHAGDEPLGELSLIAPVAVAEAIEANTALAVQIKWPNDLTIGGAKCAGVLIESREVGGVRTYAIGIGVNCTQRREDLAPFAQHAATSLTAAGASQLDRTALAGTLIRQLDHWLAEPRCWTTEALRREWKRRSGLLGSLVELEFRGERHVGWLEDVDPTASVVLRMECGAIRRFSIAGARNLRPVRC